VAERMIPEIVRYAATAGVVTVFGGLFSLLRLKMRLRFNRYVVDRAVEQGQPIDAAEIIKITTPGSTERQDTTPSGETVLVRNRGDVAEADGARLTSSTDEPVS
jgi:hypothetical protein